DKGEQGVEQLRVDLKVGDTEDDPMIILGTWRDADGKPTVEQFRISGLAGNDDIGFVEGASAVDVSDLTDRSNDWVAVIDGGPGNDILRGTGARDRLDGGSGSDKVYGFGGDDLLWGDGGPGQGLPDDFDRIYAGQGNDDVIGGQGRNYLYAWSIDPNTGGVTDGTVTDLHFEDGQSQEIVDFTTGNQVITLTGSKNAPTDGVLTRDAHFTLILADGEPVEVTVRADATNGEDGNPANSTISDLVDDINDELVEAGTRSQVVAGRNTLPDSTAGNKITLSTTGDGALLSIAIGANNTARDELKFETGDSAGRANIIATAAPATYELSADATFTLGSFVKVDPNTGNTTTVNVSVTVTATATDGNSTIEDLIDDINNALSDAFKTAGVPLQVVCGQEDGKLTLASTKTSLTLLTQFGVYVDPDTGEFHESDGGGKYNIEDTGLNRILGSPHDDSLYGGVGLDFMYGNGGNDTLYRADGTTFDSLDGGLGGNDWKEYAKESDKVWYYAASNADDVISVDYVTEPGLLQNKHLITRLTNNNGNYTFAAQVKLDLNATGDDGEPIWNASDSQIKLDSLRKAGKEGEGEIRIEYNEQKLIGGLLPPEGDFLAIIVDALDGDDQVTVGPTVQKTVWVDGGRGDDRIEFLSGNAILSDKTETPGRNDVADAAYAFGQPLLTADSPTAGANNSLSFVAKNPGADANGVTIKIIDDPVFNSDMDAARALYDSGSRTLTIKINDGYTTAQTVIDAIKNDPNAAGFVADYEVSLDTSTDPENDGTGIVRTLDGTTIEGGDDEAFACARVTSSTYILPLQDGGIPTFTLFLNGKAEGHVISLAGTADNTSIDDLVADLNRALNTAGIGQKVAACSIDGRIAFGQASTGSYLSLEIGGYEGNSQTVSNLGFVAGDSVGQAVLIATGDAPADGRLSGDARFTLSVNGADPVSVVVKADATNGNDGTPANENIDDLVADLNTAIISADLNSLVRAGRIGNKLKFSTIQGGPKASLALDFDTAETTTPEQLKFAGNQSAVVVLFVAQNTSYQGLTIDNPQDVDWYTFQLPENTETADGKWPNAKISLISASEIDGLGLAIYEADGTRMSINADYVAAVLNPDELDLGDETNDTIGDAYCIETVDALSRIYGLSIHNDDDIDWFVFSLDQDAGENDKFSLLKLEGNKNFRFELYDSDGLLMNSGETGEEDYVKLTLTSPAMLVGSGDAPLDGRLSADAVFDLEVNGAAAVTVTVTAANTSDNVDIDDLVADINDALKSGDQSGTPVDLSDDVLATRVDNKIVLMTTRSGSDATLTLNADAGNPAVTELRFLNGQTDTGGLLEKGDYYLKVSTFGPARLVASDNAPSNGKLSNDAVFDLEVNNGVPVKVTVTASSTSENTDIDDLIDDINTALGNAGLGSDVIASRSENKIVLSTTKTGADAKLALTNPNDTAVNT
ncbi:MAG: hypothetical protein DRH43_08470, partial [Deltaproteobacteria bacterium]